MRILWNKFPQIIDAMDAGGSGDPYVGLNDEEQAALHDVTSMGFPPQSWFAYKTMGVHGFAAIYPIIQAIDAGIAPRQANGDVDTAFLGPGGDAGKTVAFHLSSPAPATNFLGGDLIIKSGDAAGKSLQIRAVTGDMVILGANDAALVSRVKQGDQVSEVGYGRCWHFPDNREDGPC